MTTVRVVTQAPARSSKSYASFGVDVTPLRALSRDFRQLDSSVGTHFRSGLRSVGQVVGDRAKERARSFPRLGQGTDRIEGSIRVQQASGSIRVVAGGNDAPEAAPLEHGGQAGSFRHPLFGNQDVWVAQMAHPFLAPALDDTADEVESLLLEVVDTSLREAGFDTI